MQRWLVGLVDKLHFENIYGNMKTSVVADVKKATFLSS